MPATRPPATDRPAEQGPAKRAGRVAGPRRTGALRSSPARWLALLLMVGAACSFEFGGPGAQASPDATRIDPSPVESPVVERTGPPASCEREIASAARRYDIPLAVFYAVGLNESGAKGRLQPYAMNIDGRSSADPTLAGAVARFRDAKAAGARMIDVGCMQINHHYHGARFASLQAMFDPAQNIDYAARFLRDLKVRERTWTMAVARYNAGPDNDPAQKKYVCGVLARMIASGFGAWTESAKDFCAVSPSAKASK